MDESIVKHLVPADLDEASRLLLKAADLIETRGHYKGDFEGPRGEVCALKALTLAAGLQDWGMYEQIGPAFYRLCGDVLPARDRRDAFSMSCDLCHWNNMTPAETVVSTMRRVALGG